MGAQPDRLALRRGFLRRASVGLDPVDADAVYASQLPSPWKGVSIPLLRLAPGAPNMRVALGDVTSDGHPDVLVEQYPHTNHGCGPHEVVATLAHGRSWRIFRANLCETTLRGSRGLLALDLPYYVDGDSVCCWSKIEKVRLRWNGRRFVKAYDRIVPSRAS
jgi:hypothetical protein